MVTWLLRKRHNLTLSLTISTPPWRAPPVRFSHSLSHCSVPASPHGFTCSFSLTFSHLFSVHFTWNSHPIITSFWHILQFKSLFKWSSLNFLFSFLLTQHIIYTYIGLKVTRLSVPVSLLCQTFVLLMGNKRAPCQQHSLNFDKHLLSQALRKMPRVQNRCQGHKTCLWRAHNLEGGKHTKEPPLLTCAKRCSNTGELILVNNRIFRQQTDRGKRGQRKCHQLWQPWAEGWNRSQTPGD